MLDLKLFGSKEWCNYNFFQLQHFLVKEFVFLLFLKYSVYKTLLPTSVPLIGWLKLIVPNAAFDDRLSFIFDTLACKDVKAAIWCWL